MKKLTVVGIGKLGICTALCFEKAGYNVVGVDIFSDYCEKINRKEIYFDEPFVNDYLQDSQNFYATINMEEGLNHSDVIFIVVDTPNSGGDNHYDHSKLSNVLEKINVLEVHNKHIIICCTVMPGYIDNVAKILIENCENTTISYNPEFIAQGDIIQTFENPDIVLIGEGNKEAGDKLVDMYSSMCLNKPEYTRMTPLEAEITKISINGFITMKISFANMIGDACDKVGADKYAVMNAVGGDSRIGKKYIKPGYSFGGPCFPRDTKAISKFLRNVGVEPLLTEASGIYNDIHNEVMVNRLLLENKDEYEFEDVTFKENCKVPIIEESAKLKIAYSLVIKHNKRVIIKDRLDVINNVRKEFGKHFEYIIK